MNTDLESRVKRLENDREATYDLLTDIQATLHNHDQRFDRIDQRLDGMDQRFDEVLRRLPEA